MNTRNTILEACQRMKYEDIKTERGKTIEGLDNIKIYLNQFDTSKKIIEEFGKGYRHVILAAPTQSGKTGVMCSTINLFYRHLPSLITRVYVVTADNSNNLKYQNTERLKLLLHKGIFVEGSRVNQLTRDDLEVKYLKLSDLSKYLYDERLYHSLILIDESHYGTNDINNVLQKFLRRLGINTKADQKLYDMDCYIVSISATPFTEINSDRGYKKPIIKHIPDVNYVGWWDFLNHGNLHQVNDDNDESIIDEMYSKAMDIMNIDRMRMCSIMRCSEKKKNNNNFYRKLEKLFNVIEFNTKTENGTSYYEMEKYCIDYVDECYGNENSKPTLLMIKGTLRMGMTMSEKMKKRLACVFDNSMGLATTLQGLFGRCTGYTENGFEDVKNIHIWISKQSFDTLVYNNEIGEYICLIDIKTKSKIKKVFCNSEKIEGKKIYICGECFERRKIEVTEDIKSMSFDEHLVLPKDLIYPLLERYAPYLLEFKSQGFNFLYDGPGRNENGEWKEKRYSKKTLNCCENYINNFYSDNTIIMGGHQRDLELNEDGYSAIIEKDGDNWFLYIKIGKGRYCYDSFENEYVEKTKKIVEPHDTLYS